MCYCTPELRTPYCGKPFCKSPAEANPEPAALAAWNQVAEQSAVAVDTLVLDKLVADYKAAREDYEAKKKVSNEAHAKAEELKAKLLATLKAARKSKYHVDGVGTASIATSFAISMPKDAASKQKLFNYFREKGIHLEYLTVNYASLNSYFNTERDKDPAFKLPGVADPVAEETIRFIQSKK